MFLANRSHNDILTEMTIRKSISIDCMLNVCMDLNRMGLLYMHKRKSGHQRRHTDSLLRKYHGSQYSVHKVI